MTTQTTWLIFDTETTGMPDYGGPIENQPFLLQLSAVFAQGEQAEEVVMEMDKLLNWKIKVPREASTIHGITTAKINKHGVEPFDAIKQFDALVREADHVCAYNMQFDEAIALAAYKRVGGTGGALLASNLLCLCQSARLPCRLPGSEKQGKWPDNDPRRYKAPSLVEAYASLVDADRIVQSGKHNALEDTHLALEVLRGLLAAGASLGYTREKDRPTKVLDADKQLLDRVLNAYDEDDKRLTPWEHSYVTDYSQKLEKYGDKVYVSDKQREILNRIADKLDG